MTNLKSAIRSLRKSPGFVTVAVIALGIGLGLSTTMFAVLDAVVNPHSAYREPDRLFFVNLWTGRRQPLTPADVYRFVRDQARSFEAVVPVGGERMRLEYGGEGLDVYASLVSPRYFAAVGVLPANGRVFTESDGEDVVMLGSSLSKRLLGARRGLAGLTVTLGGRPYTVVGVLPSGANDYGVTLPLPPSIEQARSFAGSVRPLIRLRDGLTREQADAELKSLARLLSSRFGAQDQPFGLDLIPIIWQQHLRDFHKAMVGSALAVLLIACVNLAHLMLARGMAKRRELALRMALGAGRATVVRQMFTECALITLAGIAVGALVTVWGADVLRNRMPRSVSWIGLVRPQMSWRVFALGALAAATSSVLFGLLPAIRVALAVNLDEVLKDDAGTTTGRVRQRYSPLVVAEVALALVLMMGGGLLLRTVVQLQREQLGFDSRTLFRVTVGGLGRGRDSSQAARRPEVLAAIRAVEHVRDVAIVTRGVAPGGVVSAELAGDSNRTIVLRNEYGSGQYPVVSPDYFRVLGLPILRGRDFEPGDAAGTGVAIIDAIAAQRLYPNQDPVGRMIKLGRVVDQHAPWVPIVGVVRSPYILEAEGRYAPQPSVFVARADSGAYGELVIRTSTPAPVTAVRIWTRLRALPGVGRASVLPYDYARRQELLSRGFLAKVFVTMGAVALGLAVLGLYGVLAYAVTRRMREFAVRLALGAQPRRLLAMVLRDATVMLLAGIGVGAFVALGASRLLDTILVAVLPSDVLTLVACEVALLGAGLCAALAPAWRASRANPLEILRAA